MQIVKDLNLKLGLLSACFLLFAMTIYCTLGVSNFESKFESQLNAETKSVGSIAAEQYGFGDLVALRSGLTAAAINRGWTDGSFQDSTGNAIWSFKSDEIKSNQHSIQDFLWVAFHRFSSTHKDHPLSIGSQSDIEVSPGFQAGTLRVSKGIYPEWSENLRSISLSLITFFLVWLSYLLLGWFFSRKALMPLEALAKDIELSAKSVSLKLTQQTGEDELRRIGNWFRELSVSWKLATDRAIKSETIAAKSQLAQQVAHDIRSPLSALDMISSVLTEVSEEKRLIVRNAVNRIRDIANALLAKNKIAPIQVPSGDDGIHTLSSEEAVSAELIAPLIESVITEKRIQFRQHLNVDIEFCQAAGNYGVFSPIQASELQRVISNLVNNAVEALEDHTGRVRVELTSTGQDILITVTDSGKGIDKSVITKLGERGLTIDKNGGNGLGLYHAFQMVKRWNGSIEIESEIQKGTMIKLKLPRCEAAPWFVPSLILPGITEIVILDDDQSIHQLWKERLSNSEHECTRQHLSTPRELREYYGKNFDSIENCLFLMDYELIGHRETGLDLIEELGIEKQSILVTSHYEETAIRERCMRRGIKLIPKPMSGFVPLTVRLPQLQLKKVLV